MPADPQIELLVTTPHSSVVVVPIDSNTQHASTNVHIDTARDGDCCTIDADHHLVWALSPSALTLSEVQHDNIVASVQLQFPCAIVPSVASFVHQPATVHLVVLCADGQLCRITLQRGGTNAPLLHTLRKPPATWLTRRALSPSPAAPTVLTVAHGSIAIGTADGTLLCAPLDDVDAEPVVAVAELRDAGNTLGRFLSGLLSRGSTAPLVALAPLPCPPATPRRAPVLALYADAMLRVWDLDRHTVLAAASLPQLPQLAGMHPVALRVAADATGACLLCVQHRRGDDVARASSVFSVHAVEEDGSGAYRLSARCVIAQALTGVVSSCLLEGGALWALCAAEDGPQVWAANLDDPDGQWAPVALVEHPWGALLTKTDDTHLQDAVLQHMLEHATPGPAIQATLADIVRALLAGSPALKRVLQEALPGARGSACVEAAAAVVAQGDVQEHRSLAAGLRSVLQTLSNAWAATYPPCALAAGPGGAPRLIRAGALCSSFRTASPVELACLAVSGDADVMVPLGLGGERVVGALRELGGMLGPWSVLTMQVLLQMAEESSAAAELAAVALLARCAVEGPTGNTPGGQLSLSAQQLRADWARTRCRLLLHVQGSLLSAPREAVDDVLQLLADGEDAMEAGPSGDQSTSALRLAAQHVATAHAALCAQLAVLLKLDPWDAAAWGGQGIMAAQVDSLLRGSLAVVRLLTPSALQEDGPSSLMQQLTLTPTATNTALFRPLPVEGIGEGAQPSHAAFDHVLTVYSEHHNGADVFSSEHDAARRLVAWLVGPPGGPPWGLLHAALRMLCHGEARAAMDAMAHVDAATGAATAFVKGCCLLRCMPPPGAASPHCVEQQSRRAVGLLTAALAALEAPSADAVLIGEGVRALLLHLTGKDGGAAAVEGAERAKLDAYEALLLLALQAGSTPAVAHLARGALALLEAHPRVLPDEARAAARGRFWSNVFLCALDQGDFEGAYGALVQQPLASQQVDCLHRLVHSLANAGAVRTLCTLPFAGTLQTSEDEATPMPRIVHSVLSMRAATLDLTTRPAPYQVLVAWCCSRGAFHAAATALMGHLSRLQQARGELQEQHETLVSLCAMLELLPPEDAWVADPRHPPTSPDSDPSLVVCSLTRARHEAALAAARLALWRHCRGEEGVVGGLGVAETAAQLCSAGLYESALTVVREGLCSGPAQDGELVAVTRHLATAAARAQAAQPHAAAGLPEASTSSSPAAVLWSTLRTHLQWHADHMPRPQLRAAAAEAALSASRTLTLPCWLTTMFEGGLDSGDVSMGAAGDPACLLRLYMQYGRPSQAAALLLRHLSRWSRKVAGRTPAPASAWFPYALVPALLSQLEGMGEMGMVQLVAGEVNAHVQLVQHKQALLRPAATMLRVTAAPEAMDAMR